VLEVQPFLTQVSKLDGCIVWNAHNTVLGEEALLLYIVPGTKCLQYSAKLQLLRRVLISTKITSNLKCNIICRCIISII